MKKDVLAKFGSNVCERGLLLGLIAGRVGESRRGHRTYVTRVPFDDMVRRDGAERSATIRERVMAARALQQQRFTGTLITSNAEIPANAMRTYCPLGDAAMRLLATASAKRQFSACALDRIARVARTIADLATSADIHAEHVAEAIQYRSLERLDGRAA